MTNRDEQKTPEWAIENQSFSLKVPLGYYDPNGDFLHVPTNISRRFRAAHRQSGWVVKILKDNKPSIHFVLDSTHGGYKQSLQAAISLLQSISPTPLRISTTIYHTTCGDKKYANTNIVGISISKKLNRDRYEFSFRLSAGKHHTATLYIGNDRTWEQNYSEKLILAKAKLAALYALRDQETLFTA